tara:strand:- start:44 stop:178 length:135 start_codon:yes stop_codon:yes gene_type:complete
LAAVAVVEKEVDLVVVMVVMELLSSHMMHHQHLSAQQEVVKPNL